MDKIAQGEWNPQQKNHSPLPHVNTVASLFIAF